MNIVYFLGEGCSKCDNFELRASLRSIEKYGGESVGKVFVVGFCPEWLSDEVVKIPVERHFENTDSIKYKTLNISDALLYAVDNYDLGDEFLVSMDDHFYVRNVNFDKYPWYVKIYDGSPLLPTGPQKTEYRSFLSDCSQFLKEHNLPTINFAIHRNMHVDMDSLNAVRPLLEDSIKNEISIEAWLLINNYKYSQGNLKYKPVKDVKLSGGCDWWKTDPSKTQVFSTVDFEPGVGLYTLISGLYPDMSKYEKQI